MPATLPFHNRIAIAFDYDDTLAPDSYNFLLEHLGYERDAFNAERVQPLEDDGWDHIMARFYALIEESQQNGGSITKGLLEQLGRETEFFDELPQMFDRVRERAEAACPGVEVEFYLISSGIIEITQASVIAGEFETMWGCGFAFNDDGEVSFLKRVITHPEKTRYLRYLSQDGPGTARAEPEALHDEPAHGERHVPLDQVIFVGDGASDMPAFRLLNEEGGVGIGLFLTDDESEWRGQEDVSPGRRVQNLAPADYSEDSELMQSLFRAVESIGKRIALRKMGRGE